MRRALAANPEIPADVTFSTAGSIADPRLFAFSIMAPMPMAPILRQLFGDRGGVALDLQRLAGQHADVVGDGLLEPPGAGRS